jgi:hypothetical protein
LTGGRPLRLAIIAGAAALGGGAIGDFLAWDLDRAVVDAAAGAWLVWWAIQLKPARFAD